MAAPAQTLPNPADGAVFHNPGYPSSAMLHTGPAGGVSPQLSNTPVQQQAFYPGHSSGVTSPTPYSQQNTNTPDHFQQPAIGPVRANNNQAAQGQSSGSSVDKISNLVKTQLQDPAKVKQAVSALGKGYKIFNKVHHHHPHSHHPHHHHHHHHLLHAASHLGGAQQQPGNQVMNQFTNMMGNMNLAANPNGGGNLF